MSESGGGVDLPLHQLLLQPAAGELTQNLQKIQKKIAILGVNRAWVFIKKGMAHLARWVGGAGHGGGGGGDAVGGFERMV